MSRSLFIHKRLISEMGEGTFWIQSFLNMKIRHVYSDFIYAGSVAKADILFYDISLWYC